MKRTNLLILVDWYYPIGGTEVFILHLLKYLPEHCDITLGIAYFGQPELDLSMFPSKVTVVQIPHYNNGGVIRRLIREHHIDVVHCNQWALTGLTSFWAAKKEGVPVVYTNHLLLPLLLHHQITWRRFFNPFVWWFYTFACNQAAIATTPSQMVAQALKKHGAKTLPTVISCGIDTKRFSPGNQQKARVALNLPEKGPIVLSVGRLALEKHLDLLVKAWPQILTEHPEATLILVGPAAQGAANAQNQIIDLIESLGIAESVLCPGLIAQDGPELPEYYQACDIFAMPSFFEAQSIVTLEAMACGKPVIASNSSALPELVQEGINGSLFQPLNVDDLAIKLLALLNSPEKMKKMGETSRELALAHDLSKTAEKFLAVYQKAQLKR